VNAVMAMYEGAQTVVRTTEGDSKAFNVKVRLCYHCHDNLYIYIYIYILGMYRISGSGSC